MTKPASPINWRKDYEAFRGNVWNFGNYQILEQGTVYVAYHAGQRIATSASLYELQQACENKLS
jgi:hypothetical protein